MYLYKYDFYTCGTIVKHSYIQSWHEKLFRQRAKYSGLFCPLPIYERLCISVCGRVSGQPWCYWRAKKPSISPVAKYNTMSDSNSTGLKNDNMKDMNKIQEIET